ncbi:hypothetical protein GGI12_005734, partial [Dipsacomyces acuminosporus]
MEIQIADSRQPPPLQEGILHRRNTNLNIAAEFRTLSIQLSETHERTSQRREILQDILHLPKWRELLNELVPLRSAYLQRQSDEQQRDAAMIKIAEQLRGLKYHMDAINE